jgi:hypothetical protein
MPNFYLVLGKGWPNSITWGLEALGIVGTGNSDVTEGGMLFKLPG